MKEYEDGQAEYDEARLTFNAEIEKAEKKAAGRQGRAVGRTGDA